MTIRSVILSQSPTLYWPLDDATGPAAADASGNGNAGVYLGKVGLQQPGPESGTFAALFDAGGGVKTVSSSPRKVVPFSMSCWVALANVQPSSNVAIYNGRSDSTGAGLVWAPGNSLGNPIQLLRGGIGLGGAVGSVTVVSWHHIAQTWDATNAVAEYVDGALLVGSPGVPFNAIGASDWFIAGAASLGGQLLFAAHVALFSVALSAVQVAAQFSAPAALQSPPVVPSESGNAALLADVLKYVHKFY